MSRTRCRMSSALPLGGGFVSAREIMDSTTWRTPGRRGVEVLVTQLVVLAAWRRVMQTSRAEVERAHALCRQCAHMIGARPLGGGCMVRRILDKCQVHDGWSAVGVRRVGDRVDVGTVRVVNAADHPCPSRSEAIDYEAEYDPDAQRRMMRQVVSIAWWRFSRDWW